MASLNSTDIVVHIISLLELPMSTTKSWPIRALLLFQQMDESGSLATVAYLQNALTDSNLMIADR